MPLPKLLEKKSLTDLEIKQLADDHRIRHAWWSSLKKGVVLHDSETKKEITKNQIIDEHKLIVRKWLSLGKQHNLVDDLDDTLPEDLKKKSKKEESIIRNKEILERLLIEDIDKIDQEGVKINLGAGRNIMTGFINIDKVYRKGIDIVYDLEEGIPFEDDSVSVVIAYHILEHLEDKIKIMEEIWRVLKLSCLCYFEVPSTDGRGAFADPTHKSFWNKLSFQYYVQDNLRCLYNIKAKFEIVSLEDREDKDWGTVYVRGCLKAIK